MFLGAEDEQAAIDQVAAALNIATIDFDRDMLVALSAGPVRGRKSLRHLHASDVSAKDNELHIEWTIQRRMERASDPLLHPVRFLMATKFNGKVVIHPPQESLQ